MTNRQIPRTVSPEDARDGHDYTDASMQVLPGYLMKRAYMTLSSVASQTLAELDLRTHSFTTLMLIVENPGISQSRLAALLNMERSNIVVIIDELETRGLINRKRAPTDRRRYALHATLIGRRLADRGQAAVQQAERRTLSSLTDGEQQTLMMLLQKIAY